MNQPAVRGAFPRSTRHSAVFLILAASAIALTAADDPVVPRRRLEPGRVLHFEASQTTTIESRPARGAGVRSESHQEVGFHWTVGKVEDDVADVTLTIDRVRVKLAGDGRSAAFEFDTASDPAPEVGVYDARLTTVLKGLIGSEPTFRLDARGEVADVRLPDALLTLIRTTGSLGGAPILSEDGVRNLVVQSAPPLPEGPVEPGTTWARQSAAAMPMFGSLIRDETYTYRGPRAGAPDLLDVELDVRASLQPAPEPAIEMRLLKQSAEGGFAFDAATGVVESYRRDESLTFAFSTRGQRIERSISERLVVEHVPPPKAPAAPAAPAPPPR